MSEPGIECVPGLYIRFEVTYITSGSPTFFRVGSHLIPFSPNQEILRSSREEGGEERVGQGDGAYGSEGVEDEV